MYDWAGLTLTGMVRLPVDYDMGGATCARDHSGINNSRVYGRARLRRPGSFIARWPFARTNRNTVVETGNRLTSFDGFALSYDADGNLISKSKPGFSQTFAWNSLGQLTQVVTNNVTLSYAYDGLGRLARSTQPSTTIQYVWDGDDLFLEQNASGAVTEYTYYPGVDQPHSIKRGNSIHFYATDYPSNVVGLIGSQQGLANEYVYTPFGAREYARQLCRMARSSGGSPVKSRVATPMRSFVFRGGVGQRCDACHRTSSH